MPLPKDSTTAAIHRILQTHSLEEALDQLQSRDPEDSPLAANLPKQTDLTVEAQYSRLSLLRNEGASLPYVEGAVHIKEPEVFEGNIENYIGLTQIPTGIIGPLRINGLYAHGDFYVPLATTEGTLVASYNRGARAISMSGGATVMCLHEKVSRAPGFCFHDMREASQFIVWCVNNFERMQVVAATTTSHGKLENMNTTLTGNLVFLNLEYFTGDASGQNMVTIASEAVCQFIIANSPIKPRHFFIESNMSGDKKATALSFLSVRGKKVTAEAYIPRNILQKYLHTTPEMMMEYWKMSFVGGVQSGSLGVQGHIANGLAAIFLSCGQDVACVAEAAVGITRFDLTAKGDFYISVTLPNLIVGTVGGGTGLPTQSECLSLIGCKGSGNAKKFAEICTATVLAGELSITGALVAGHFAKAHKTYGRKKSKS
jgi:hydroxymethylglutaryl-CoA reductase (NADPH)